jgi:hypothetical protein
MPDGAPPAVRKIKSHFFISLDGVVESPDKWHFPYFDDESAAGIAIASAAAPQPIASQPRPIGFCSTRRFGARTGRPSATFRSPCHFDFAALAARPTGDRAHRLRWSTWRRRHQARARACHYRRQAAWDP